MDLIPDFHSVYVAVVPKMGDFQTMATRFRALFFGDKVISTCVWDKKTKIAIFKVSSPTEIERLPMRIFSNEIWKSKKAKLIAMHANCPDQEPENATFLGVELKSTPSTPSCLLLITAVADFGFWDFFNLKAEAAIEKFETNIEEMLDTTSDAKILRTSLSVNKYTVSYVVERRDAPLSKKMKNKIKEVFQGLTILAEVYS